MKYATTLFLTIASVCIGQASSFPLSWSSRDLLPKRNPQPQSYSVVPVDGGSSTTAATATAPVPAPTKTVTDAITQVETATVMSTIIATASGAGPVTSVATQTVTLSTEASVTSVPYDNGQWHTTYYFRSTVTPQANFASATTQSTSQASPTADFDPGQWTYWSERSGNGQPKV